MQAISGVAVGALFGLGLVISGMAQPGKVLAYLDVAGNWDPSLMFVMAGAIGSAICSSQRLAQPSRCLSPRTTPNWGTSFQAIPCCRVQALTCRSRA